ncbi:uncharacterized protein LOC131254117 [Magnolia sinica]|uniref:uncharacterized protein LOC131254117 n=1 Tax=Magnolia sinica TaxID=86752 RepID=UPI00265A6599|nr:uncharacterized protein LOC131254117 [Magnolia sinica]
MASARLWLLEMGLIRPRSGPSPRPTTTRAPSIAPDRTHQTLGILSFETAKAMSRLLALYSSLSDEQFHYLRFSVFRTEGVAHLNSRDEGFLIHLVCIEKLEDLDRAAAAISRLGTKCGRPELRRFDKIYAELKLGTIDFSKSMIPIKKLDRKIAKMEKFVSATSGLYSGLELLAELEVSERKLQFWKSYSGPLSLHKPNSGLFDEKLAWQRRHVKRMRAASLWNQPFDDTVQLMARMVCNVFARICILFGPYFSDLPQVLLDRNMVFVISSQKLQPQRVLPIHASGPLERFVARGVISGNFGSNSKNHVFGSEKFWKREKAGSTIPIQEISFGLCLDGSRRRIVRKRKRIMAEPSVMTVGFAALALQYARVIIMAEKILNLPDATDGDLREELYQKLPLSMRKSTKAKMRGFIAGTAQAPDQSFMDGLNEEVRRKLGWLVPMARDTMQWQAERNFERQQFDLRPTVLLLQTLYFSDRKKTEEAIVEVLVGLSCIFLYKSRCPVGDGGEWKGMKGNEKGGIESGSGADQVGHRPAHLLIGPDLGDGLVR